MKITSKTITMTALIAIFALISVFPAKTTKASSHQEPGASKVSGSKKHDHGDQNDNAHGEHKGHGDHNKSRRRKHDDHDGDEHKGHGDHSENGEQANRSEGSDHSDHAEGGEHGGSSSIGPGKAIVEQKREGKKLKISKETEETFKIQKSPVRLGQSDNTWVLPKDAVVAFRDEYSVFVFYNGWYESVPIKIIDRSASGVTVSYNDSPSDNPMVVTQGREILRIAQLEASGQGGQGHAH